MHLPHLRPFVDHPLVFVTCCTLSRRDVLACEDARVILRDLWQESASRNGWYVGRYMIMMDHVHFFACPTKDAISLARWMATWKSLAARRLSRMTLNGKLWQEGYFDRFLRTADSYSEKWEYVRMNPVRKGLVADPDDWPYQGVINDLRF